MTKFYRLSGRLFSRRAFGAALRAYGKEISWFTLYAAWLVGACAAAIYLLMSGAHPAIALFALLFLDIVGRGIFRARKIDFRSWKNWFNESYIENLKLIPRWIYVLFSICAALYAAYSFWKSTGA